MNKKREQREGFVQQVSRRLKDNESVEIDEAETLAEHLQHMLPDQPEEREKLKDDIEPMIRDTARGLLIQDPKGRGLIQPIGAHGTIAKDALKGLDRDFHFVTTDFQQKDDKFAVEIQGLVTHEELTALLGDEAGQRASVQELSSGDTLTSTDQKELTVVAQGKSTCLIRLYTPPTDSVVQAMKSAAKE